MNLQWIENGEITHIYFMMLLFVIKSNKFDLKSKYL